MSRRAGGWSNVRPKATDTNLIPEYDAVNDPWCPHTKQNKFQTHIKKVVGYQQRSQKPTGRLQSPGEYVGSPHRARGGQQRQRGHMVAMNQPPQRRLSAPVDDGMKPRKALPSLPGNRNNILGGRERRWRRKALFTMSRSSLLLIVDFEVLQISPAETTRSRKRTPAASFFGTVTAHGHASHGAERRHPAQALR